MCLFGTKEESPSSSLSSPSLAASSSLFTSTCSSICTSTPTLVSPPVPCVPEIELTFEISHVSGIDMLRQHMKSMSSKQLLTPIERKKSFQSSPALSRDSSTDSSSKSSPVILHSMESSLPSTPMPSHRSSPSDSPMPNIRGLNILQQYTIDYAEKQNIVPYSNIQKNIFKDLSLETS